MIEMEIEIKKLKVMNKSMKNLLTSFQHSSKKEEKEEIKK